MALGQTKAPEMDIPYLPTPTTLQSAAVLLTKGNLLLTTMPLFKMTLHGCKLLSVLCIKLIVHIIMVITIMIIFTKATLCFNDV